MSAGDAYENKILDAILGDNHAPNMPDPVYLALFSVAPNDGYAGVEFIIGTGGYARVSVANDTAHWLAAAGSKKRNAVDMAFPTATADWGLAVAAGIFDAPVAGGLLLSGLLRLTRNIVTGVTPKFTINQLVLTCD